ncbi:class I SAM-dependent methyltransferase [Desulfovibrio sp. TomC]|uniref:class I SAM-dependent methyltransferase n=1 Tax=Desulfovibrio sp. TomC TaxID=1562888 RepID=UPI0005737624|nr:class I SAM-dependent methyltransferase [Desulfovibrio sp. TomC]KHK00290.1 Methyltransferase type 11 [Desulfovibrio sp. TomC]
MNRELFIYNKLHKQTQRDFLGRMQDDKIGCMKIAKCYDREFWDGDRRFGYGGYHYDGRWNVVARDLIQTYNLPQDARIFEVGCGKGYLLYELSQLLPKAQVAGCDISRYAIENAKPEIKDRLSLHRAQDAMPFADQTFDLVFSIATLHNLPLQDLKPALQEIERIGRQHYVCIESYRNETELFALQCWALTAETFLSFDSWRWLFSEFGYSGDYEFITF